MPENEEPIDGYEVQETNEESGDQTAEHEDLHQEEENENGEELLLSVEEDNQQMYKLIENIDERLNSMSLMMIVIVMIVFIKGIFQ